MFGTFLRFLLPLPRFYRVNLVLGSIALGCMARGSGKFEWHELPPLPPPDGQSLQLGIAGAFVGPTGTALLVAGGANYPTPRVDGGAKTFRRELYVLERPDGKIPRWTTNTTLKLPRPRGYGGSVTIDDGLLCIGGSDDRRCATDVVLLKWDPRNRSLSSEEWPALPEPAVDIASAQIGHKIFVAGGKAALNGPSNHSTRNFWVLDSSNRRPERFQWRRLPPLPGPPRSKAILVAQSVHGNDRIFLFSGRSEEPGKATLFLTDAYAYDVSQDRWETLRHVASGTGDGSLGRSVMVGTGIPLPNGEIAIFSGSDGALYEISDDLNRRVASAEEALKSAVNSKNQPDLVAKLAAAITARRRFVAEFPGFSKDVLLYNPMRDEWRKLGEFPGLPPVTTTSAIWEGRIVIPSGEIAPGIRTDKVWTANIQP